MNDVLALKHQALTFSEITAKLGYHPATISKWRASRPPGRRQSQAPPLIDERVGDTDRRAVARSPRLLATSVFEIIVAEGFAGSCRTVSRYRIELHSPELPGGGGGERADREAPGEEVLLRLR